MHYILTSSIESEDRMTELFLNLENGYQEALGKIIKDIKFYDILVRDLMKCFGFTDNYTRNKLLDVLERIYNNTEYGFSKVSIDHNEYISIRNCYDSYKKSFFENTMNDYEQFLRKEELRKFLEVLNYICSSYKSASKYDRNCCHNYCDKRDDTDIFGNKYEIGVYKYVFDTNGNKTQEPLKLADSERIAWNWIELDLNKYIRKEVMISSRGYINPNDISILISKDRHEVGIVRAYIKERIIVYKIKKIYKLLKCSPYRY